MHIKKEKERGRQFNSKGKRRNKLETNFDLIL